jgi:hypothetical protein
MARWRSVGTIDPAGSPAVLAAGAGEELARTRRMAVRAEAASQPEERRRVLGIRALTI